MRKSSSNAAIECKGYPNTVNSTCVIQILVLKGSSAKTCVTFTNNGCHNQSLDCVHFLFFKKDLLI